MILAYMNFVFSIYLTVSYVLFIYVFLLLKHFEILLLKVLYKYSIIIIIIIIIPIGFFDNVFEIGCKCIPMFTIKTNPLIIFILSIITIRCNISIRITDISLDVSTVLSGITNWSHGWIWVNCLCLNNWHNCWNISIY